MRTSIVFALLIALGSNAIAKELKPPAELMATVSLGPDTTLDDLRAFVDAVRPGAGAALNGALVRQQLAGLVGATSLEGLDPSAPTYVLLVDGGAPLQGIAVVGRVGDADALARGLGGAESAIDSDWAVIGSKPVVAAVAHYALVTLPSLPSQRSPTAQVYVPQLIKRYHTEIDAARKLILTQAASAQQGQMALLAKSYVEGMYSAVTDCDRLVVTLDVTKDLGAIDFALVPKPGTRLAKFIAAQRPSTFALLDKLPAAPPTVLMAGHLDSGPYRAGLIDMMSMLYGHGESKELITAMDAIMKASSGELAASVQFGSDKPMQLTQLFGLADKQLAERSIHRLLEAFKLGRTMDSAGISTTIKTNPTPMDHDGVQLLGYDVTYDYSKAPEPTRKVMEAMVPGGTTTARVATFDQLCLIALGADPAGALDASRGKAPTWAPVAAIAELLKQAITRKDSILLMMDAGALSHAAKPGLPLPFIFTIGFADKAAHLRATLPAATARGLVP